MSCFIVSFSSRFFSRLVLLLSIALLPPFAARAQGVHDFDGLPEARLLQQQKLVTEGWPKGLDGRPDWVKALENGLISPRSTRSGAPRPAETLGEMPREGIVFSNTQFMPHVVFPHAPHAEWLACANCHDTLFERKATGRGKGMTAIFQGEHCGFCHGRVAFSPEGSCYRCHSKPNPAALQGGSPFVAPTRIEQAPVVEEEEPRRRRGARRPPPIMGGRLAPSVVPPPVMAPTVPKEAPELQ